MWCSDHRKRRGCKRQGKQKWLSQIRSRSNERRSALTVAHNFCCLLCHSDQADARVQRNGLLNGALVHAGEELRDVLGKCSIVSGERRWIGEDVAFVRVRYNEQHILRRQSAQEQYNT
jgi:hypothetical protein